MAKPVTSMILKTRKPARFSEKTRWQKLAQPVKSQSPLRKAQKDLALNTQDLQLLPIA